jgi:hypothetical protein
MRTLRDFSRAALVLATGLAATATTAVTRPAAATPETDPSAAPAPLTPPPPAPMEPPPPAPPAPPAPAVTAAPRPASGEIQFSVAAGGEGSAWHGDGAGFVGLRAGFRFRDLIGPYFLARMGYGHTNERVLEMIQLGAQIWGRLGITRPYFRAGFLHQHEQPWAAYKVDLVNSFLGVSDGIAHRNGGEFAAGLDIPFKQLRSWQFHATVEALTTVFPPDNKGPRIYGGGTLGLGFNYAL